MKKALTIFLTVLDWIFFALLVISIYFLIVTNYYGFNFLPFLAYGSMIIIFFLLFYYFRKIIWAVKEKAQTGPEAIVGKTGLAVKDLNPEGEVRIEGIIWKARSLNNEFIENGSYVIVKNLENITLVVEKVKK
ncbi:MAG: NfeD family protein [Thermoplasmata archaeon]|nr:NfeD family protein [Thermoplasmata archaeon]